MPRPPPALASAPRCSPSATEACCSCRCFPARPCRPRPSGPSLARRRAQASRSGRCTTLVRRLRAGSSFLSRSTSTSASSATAQRCPTVTARRSRTRRPCARRYLPGRSLSRRATATRSARTLSTTRRAGRCASSTLSTRACATRSGTWRTLAWRRASTRRKRRSCCARTLAEQRRRRRKWVASCSTRSGGRRRLPRPAKHGVADACSRAHAAGDVRLAVDALGAAAAQEWQPGGGLLGLRDRPLRAVPAAHGEARLCAARCRRAGGAAERLGSWSSFPLRSQCSVLAGVA
mmetsp:Transcript_50314/g.168089  ORF Transcript_50314/g.168089 Transcript_50314/m.168089 type:complete len:291 (+) Transcript_50314:281-1153(+)